MINSEYATEVVPGHPHPAQQLTRATALQTFFHVKKFKQGETAHFFVAQRKIAELRRLGSFI